MEQKHLRSNEKYFLPQIWSNTSVVKYFCGSHSDKWILEGIIDSKKVIYYILKVTCATEQLEKSFSWRESFQMLRVNPSDTSSKHERGLMVRQVFQTDRYTPCRYYANLAVLFIYLFVCFRVVVFFFFSWCSSPDRSCKVRSGSWPQDHTWPTSGAPDHECVKSATRAPFFPYSFSWHYFPKMRGTTSQ